MYELDMYNIVPFTFYTSGPESFVFVRKSLPTAANMGHFTRTVHVFFATRWAGAEEVHDAVAPEGGRGGRGIFGVQSREKLYLAMTNAVDSCGMRCWKLQSKMLGLSRKLRQRVAYLKSEYHKACVLLHGDN